MKSCCAEEGRLEGACLAERGRVDRQRFRVLDGDIMVIRLKVNVPAETKPASISQDKEYRVLSIEGDMYRILNDQADPVLYEAGMFDIIDPAIPTDWVVERDGEGEINAGPAGFPPYTWEDCHDGVPAAREVVLRYLHEIGPCAWVAGVHRP